MSYKIVSSTKKTIISLFLSVILVTGTIAALSLSTFITGANAQSPSPSYYNNGIDNNYKFQKGSIKVNKIKCISDNININGVNSGDVNVGNKGQGYVGAYSSGDEGYNGYDGQNYKKDKAFECIINNNNNNTNVAAGNGGNQTTPGNQTAPQTPCEECFSVNSTLQAVVEEFLINQTEDSRITVLNESLIIPGDVDTIEQLCSLLEGHTDVLLDSVITTFVEQQTGSFTAFAAEIDALIECLLEAGVIVEATV